MNHEQILSLVRQILLFAGGFIVAKGWLDQETLIALVGAIIAAATSYFAFKSRTQKSLVKAAADIVPISPFDQKEVGIANPQTIPSNPPK